MLSLFVEFYLKLSMINEELALTTLVDEHIFGPKIAASALPGLTTTKNKIKDKLSSSTYILARTLLPSTMRWQL